MIKIGASKTKYLVKVNTWIGANQFGLRILGVKPIQGNLKIFDEVVDDETDWIVSPKKYPVGLKSLINIDEKHKSLPNFKSVKSIPKDKIINIVGRMPVIFVVDKNMKSKGVLSYVEPLKIPLTLKNSGKVIKHEMDGLEITIKDLAKEMGLTNKRIKEVLKKGAETYGIFENYLYTMGIETKYPLVMNKAKKERNT